MLIILRRFQAYAEKKAGKPAGVAKSNIIFDVKPWDDTISLQDIETNVRSIEIDGLVWGTAKILPVAFGINKLQVFHFIPFLLLIFLVVELD